MSCICPQTGLGAQAAGSWVGEGAEGWQAQARCLSPGVPGVAGCSDPEGWAEAWVWAGGEQGSL